MAISFHVRLVAWRYFIFFPNSFSIYNETMESERWPGTIISIPCNHHKISALFYRTGSGKDRVENKPVVLRLHGILGSLLDETEHSLSTFLARAGYSSLTMNTLLANLGLFFGFGIFDNVMPQIDTACDFLRQEGFKKIVIAGQGLGGCMAVRYAALRNDPVEYPDLVGLIALAMPYSMPDTVRRRWERFGSHPSYDEVYELAKRVCKPVPGEQPADDEIVSINIAHGDTFLPEHTDVYTLKTWWALAGPEAEGAKPYRHIGKIRVPIFLAHGLHDDFIEQREFEELAGIARESGNDDVTEVCLETGHKFEGKHNELGEAIVKWLSDKFEQVE
jgi:pimeloyl-ACP methyl ester carboxylesterase